jgi:hypothetical protein
VNAVANPDTGLEDSATGSVDERIFALHSHHAHGWGRFGFDAGQDADMSENTAKTLCCNRFPCAGNTAATSQFRSKSRNAARLGRSRQCCRSASA